MIKNIIFDMGNVLICFEPDAFIGRTGISREDAELLKKTVFEAKEWKFLDTGELDEPDLVVLMKTRLPERLHRAMEEAVTKWDRPIKDMPGMAALACELKGKGYGIYLLSNASRRQHEYWPRIAASKYFDGTVISADIRIIKPEPGIYKTLFEKFDLVPEECFFVDDLPANIEAGRALGMDGFVFGGSADALRDELAAKGIL